MTPQSNRLPQMRLRNLRIILAALFLVMLAGSVWFYLEEETAARNAVHGNLEAISAMKVGQIVQWRQERLSDATDIMTGPYLGQMIERWLAAAGAEDRDRIVARFRGLQRHQNFRDVLLVDKSGRVRLSLSGREDTLNGEALATLRASLAAHEPLMSDPHSRANSEPIHVDVLAPLYSGSGEAMGAIVLQTATQEYLYPMVQSWPTRSATAETLLVRRDGDAVLFLNELRHRPDTALKLRIPLTRLEIPSVNAVLGRQGIFEGRDYRDVPVISVLKPIPDTSWFLITKVDTAEAYADWHVRARLIFGIAFALALIGLLSLSWMRNNVAHFRNLFSAEAARRESEARHLVTLMSVGDAVITTDAQARITLMNPVAEALTGWRQEDALGQALEAVFVILDEENRQVVHSPAERVLREGRLVGPGKRTVLLARDGSEHPIADSGAPIFDSSGAISGVVLVFRDQSGERKLNEERDQLVRRLRTEMEFSQSLIDSLPGVFYVISPDARFERWNKTFEEVTGRSAGEMARINPADMFVEEDQALITERIGQVFSTGESSAEARLVLRNQGSRP